MSVTRIFSVLILLAAMSLTAEAAIVTLINDGGTTVDLTTNAKWRDPAVAKPHDQGEDNVYGTDGFYLFEYSHPNYAWSARNTANDLVWLPTYISSVTDNLTNGYGDNANYGQINNPADYLTFGNSFGRTASGAIWNFNAITIVRNGNTGPFRLTVFAAYNVTANGPEQVYVRSGTDPEIGGVIYYQNTKTNYVSFLIGAGSDNVTVRVYSGANNLSGLAFDGLAERQYNMPASVMHYDCDAASGAVHYAGGGVTISAPAQSTAQVYQGTKSAAITFDTGAAGATYGATNMWPAWRSIPTNMRAFKFASYAPVGTVFQIGLENNGTWGVHATPAITQTVAGWQVNSFLLTQLAPAVNPKTLAAQLGTVRLYINGAAQGGPQGLAGTIYVDGFEFLTAPLLQVTPAAVPFGSVDVATGQSAAQNVIVTNRGNAQLTFSGAGFAVTGTNAADFAITNSPATTALDANTSRTVAVAFDPTVNGNKTANLTITTNDIATPTYNVVLDGTAVPVELSEFGVE